MKPSNIEQALELVPEHYLLKAGAKFKKGDEWLGMNTYMWNDFPTNAEDHPGIVSEIMSARITRRPIPQEIREAMAQWMVEMCKGDWGPGFASWPFESWLLSQGEQSERMPAL